MATPKKELISEEEDHDIIIMREQNGHEIAVGIVANFKIGDEYFLKALQEFIDMVVAGEISLSDVTIDPPEGLH